MKYLVLFGVLLAVYLVLRAGRARSSGDLPPGARRRPPPQPPAAQDMVRCEVCGLHLPRSESLSDGRGRNFCSPEHRQQAS